MPPGEGALPLWSAGTSDSDEAVPDNDVGNRPNTNSGSCKHSLQRLSQTYARTQTPLSQLNLNSGLSTGTAHVHTLYSELPAHL